MRLSSPGRLMPYRGHLVHTVVLAVEAARLRLSRAKASHRPLCSVPRSAILYMHNREVPSKSWQHWRCPPRLASNGLPEPRCDASSAKQLRWSNNVVHVLASVWWGCRALHGPFTGSCRECPSEKLLVTPPGKLPPAITPQAADFQELPQKFIQETRFGRKNTILGDWPC